MTPVGKTMRWFEKVLVVKPRVKKWKKNVAVPQNRYSAKPKSHWSQNIRFIHLSIVIFNLKT